MTTNLRLIIVDTAADSEHFGFNYESSKNMTCDNTGPFHLGISREACNNAKGRWKRGPCKQLKECVSNYPKKGELGYSLSFAHYAEQRLYIEDANNEEQCNDTRAALGFPQDYPFDHDVCEEFNKRLCEPKADFVLNNTNVTPVPYIAPR